MQKSDVKSSIVAGILGVFLGAFGGHDWYLGNTKKAIMHTSLCVGGLILLLVGVILDNLSQSVPVINMLFICLIIMSYVIIVGNAVWGMIEGIMILAQGDAGLQAKGYKVADSVAPMTMANPNANPDNANVATNPVKTTIATPGVKVENETVKEPVVDASGANGAVGVTGNTDVANNAVASAPVAQVAGGQASSAADGTQVTGGVAGTSANAVNVADNAKTEANVATAPAAQTSDASETANAAVTPVQQPVASVAAGASVQPAMGSAAEASVRSTATVNSASNSTSVEEESDVKLVEHSSLPQQSTDEEIAKAAEQAVSQANQAMGKE